MRSLVARLAVLGAFAVAVSACGGGNGTSLPFAGPPNNAGGNSGSLQSGSNGIALVRFIQGSPDASPASGEAVDVCVDNLPYGVTAPAVAYGKQAAVAYAIPGGIGHTIAVYPSLGGASVGAECPTAPGPYVGTSAIKVTTISPAVSTRQTIVLGGTVAGKTLGLYVYAEPTFPIAPGGPETISHNAAPTFSAARAVGVGTCSTTVTPCVTAAVLAGAGNIGPPRGSSTTTVFGNTPVVSALSGVPAGFYDGIGVKSGTPVPITSIAASAVAGQPFVVQLYAIDGPAGGLNLVGYVESTLGYGF